MTNFFCTKEFDDFFFFNQVGLKEGIDSDLNSFVDPSLFLSHDPPHRVIASLYQDLPCCVHTILSLHLPMRSRGRSETRKECLDLPKADVWVLQRRSPFKPVHFLSQQDGDCDEVTVSTTQGRDGLFPSGPF